MSIFTNLEKNIRITVDVSFDFQIATVNTDLKLLAAINRMLESYVRSAPLDGGQPANFSHEINLKENYILIAGDVGKAVCALCELDWISESLRDDIMQDISIKFIASTLATIVPAKRQEFKNKVDANFPPPALQKPVTTLTAV